MIANGAAILQIFSGENISSSLPLYGLQKCVKPIR